MLAMMLGDGSGHLLQLGILKLIGIIGGYPAAHGDMGQLIFDDVQVFAGQAASAGVGH